MGPLDDVPGEKEDGDDEFTYAYQLLGEDDPAAFARYLTTHIHAQDHYCGAVTDYQIVVRSIRRLSVKARCLGMPLYGISVRPKKPVQVFGGDGLVAPLTNTDGPVVNVPLVSVQKRKDNVEGSIAISVPGSSDEIQFNLSPWIIISVGVNIFLVFALIVYIVTALRKPKRRRRKRRSKQHEPVVEVAANASLSSVDKNTLIGQSEQVSRLIYYHPSGVYIAKGRRGKRRVFSNLLGAILYRDFGLKWRELR